MQPSWRCCATQSCACLSPCRGAAFCRLQAPPLAGRGGRPFTSQHWHQHQRRQLGPQCPPPPQQQQQWPPLQQHLQRPSRGLATVSLRRAPGPCLLMRCSSPPPGALRGRGTCCPPTSCPFSLAAQLVQLLLLLLLLLLLPLPPSPLTATPWPSCTTSLWPPLTFST